MFEKSIKYGLPNLQVNHFQVTFGSFSSIDNLRVNDTISKLVRNVNNHRNKIQGTVLFEPED